MQRSTRQRDAIVDAFSSQGRPLSPQEILEVAGALIPGLGMATVYRNLRTMEEDGILQAVLLPGQSPMYEFVTQEHHHHFKCTACARVFDVHKCPGDLAGLAPPGFVVDRHDIVLYGQCPDCRPAPRRSAAKKAQSLAKTPAA